GSSTDSGFRESAFLAAKSAARREHHPCWRHDLVIYIPDEQRLQTALFGDGAHRCAKRCTETSRTKHLLPSITGWNVRTGEVGSIGQSKAGCCIARADCQRPYGV